MLSDGSLIHKFSHVWTKIQEKGKSLWHFVMWEKSQVMCYYTCSSQIIHAQSLWITPTASWVIKAAVQSTNC